MKHWKYLLLLLICIQASAQDSIYKADGTKLKASAGSIVMDQRQKQLTYKLPDADKPQTIGYKDLSKATFDGRLFRIFGERKKAKGFYVLTEHDGLSLAAISARKTSSVGGFNVPYVLHEVVIFKDGKAVDKISFTENNDRKNINKRVAAREMITSHFAECVAVLERLAYFANTNSNNLQEGDIVAFLKSPYQRCN